MLLVLFHYGETSWVFLKVKIQYLMVALPFYCLNFIHILPRSVSYIKLHLAL